VTRLVGLGLYGRNREQSIARCMDVLEPLVGGVCFVHVHCYAETLRQRMIKKDRKQHGKITSLALLNELLSNLAPQAPLEAAIR
jgi:hypothetical protein